MARKDTKMSSKERIRTGMEFQRVKGRLREYAGKCRELEESYTRQEREADRGGDHAAKRQCALGRRVMFHRRLTTERIQLSLETMMLEMDRESLERDFLDYARMFAAARDPACPETKEYRRIMSRISHDESQLLGFVDAITHSILVADENNLDDIINGTDDDHGTEREEHASILADIESKLRDIESYLAH